MVKKNIAKKTYEIFLAIVSRLRRETIAECISRNPCVTAVRLGAWTVPPVTGVVVGERLNG